MTNVLKKMVKQHRLRQQQEQYRLGQGRLTAVEAAERLAGEYAIPLCSVESKGKPITIGMSGQPSGGHLLVVAPPASGWVDQIVCTLAQWPDAALVMDSGGKLHARTSHFRQQRFGPVYTLPGYRLNLGHYYRFWNEGQTRKLHGYLMSPYPPEDRWLMERSVALFAAAGHYAYARKRNLMHVLLDVAACDLQLALKGLETIPYARLYTRQFSKGQSPQEAIHDADVTQAYSLFARHLQRYQAHYDTFGTEPVEEVIPRHWVQKRSTIYLTYDRLLLAEIGGLATAVIAGLVRYHLSHGDHKRLLLVLDVATADQIPHFSQLLQMVGDYGITIILLVPSWEALRTVAGQSGRAQFIGHFANQLWYPPHDEETAQQMSKLLGRQIGLDSVKKEPVLTSDEILTWAENELLVLLRRERPYRFIGQRLKLPDNMHLYQAPLLPPTATPAPRHYLDWLPALPTLQPPQVAPNPKALPPATKIIMPQEEKKPSKRRRKKGWK